MHAGLACSLQIISSGDHQNHDNYSAKPVSCTTQATTLTAKSGALRRLNFFFEGRGSSLPACPPFLFRRLCSTFKKKLTSFLDDIFLTVFSAGNYFSFLTGHMSFQIFILVGHFTNWTGHNLLTDNTLKKITEDVVVRCSVIVSDHNAKLAGHIQNLVTDCYFQY